jgi:hypothetical protein
MSLSSKVSKQFGAVSSSYPSVMSVSGTSLGSLLQNTSVIAVTTTGAATAALADGTLGKRIVVMLVVDGGDLVLTPTTFVNGSTITFANAGESADLLYTSVGWVAVSTTGVIA